MEQLHEVDDTTLIRMVRYALRTGGDQLRFRPGRRPEQIGIGGDRELNFRQLTGCDTSAISRLLLDRVRVSERLRAGPPEAGCSLPVLVELRGEALLEARFASVPGGIQVALDLIRALPDPLEVDLFEL
jgi:hypothetical protein